MVQGILVSTRCLPIALFLLQILAAAEETLRRPRGRTSLIHTGRLPHCPPHQLQHLHNISRRSCSSLSPQAGVLVQFEVAFVEGNALL